MDMLKQRTITARTLAVALAALGLATVAWARLPYPIVDTGQNLCFDEFNSISAPQAGEPFFGQDAQHQGNQPDYILSNDGLTVLDNVTGLTWTQSPDLNGDGVIDINDKLTQPEALLYVDTLNAAWFGGYNDWRLPSIKELYSLIRFDGSDPSSVSGDDTSMLTPFIDTDYFAFDYGDTTAGERIIDAQFCTTTISVSPIMWGTDGDFGVNFADGRIKCYDMVRPDSSEKLFYVLYVRGNTDYGANNLAGETPGTVTDAATGLMWQKADSGYGMTWQQALEYAENLELDGYDDWRLPNAKELQSIVDYSRSPDATGSAAIDPIFSATPITNEGDQTDYPFYWTSTTHEGYPNHGDTAAYVAFGRALGWMQQPPDSGNYILLDVHGAGAQRSDPKLGDPADYPYGRGPQGDVIRIYNYVRCVRDVDAVAPACGDADHPYPPGDINHDCYVNLKDIAIMLENWLNCTDPQPPCDYQP